MKNERIHTDVEVNIVDLTSLETSALQHFNEKSKTKALSMNADHVWGYVETAEGLYFICGEGVGDKNPITNKNKAELGFYAGYEDGAKICFCL